MFNVILVQSTAKTLVCGYDGELPIHIRPIDDDDLASFGIRLPGYLQNTYVTVYPLFRVVHFYSQVEDDVFRTFLMPLSRSQKDKRFQVREVLNYFQLRPNMGYFSTVTGKGVNKPRATKFLKEHLAVLDCSSTANSDCFVVRHSTDLDPWSNRSVIHWLDGRIYVRKTATPTLIPRIKEEFLEKSISGMN